MVTTGVPPGNLQFCHWVGSKEKQVDRKPNLSVEKP
jgi:hypothetical protein